jgi:WD40 repeat protein
LRRGSDSAEVFSIAFDPVSKFIACSSDKGTIHIFAIRGDVSLAATSHKQLGEIN